jgi:hypothetical protein
MSLPVNIENPSKYKRGSFEFNFCFIISAETYVDIKNQLVICTILKKVSSILAQMELENDFLSCSLAGAPPKSDLKDPLKIEHV